MMTAQELTVEEPASTNLADLAYHLAMNQCEALCQVWGGIRDGQILSIINNLSGLSQQTRSSYYWQLRLHYPNPYE